MSDIPTISEVEELKVRITKVAEDFEAGEARSKHDANTIRAVLGLISLELDGWMARLIEVRKLGKVK